MTHLYKKALVSFWGMVFSITIVSLYQQQVIFAMGNQPMMPNNYMQPGVPGAYNPGMGMPPAGAPNTAAGAGAPALSDEDMQFLQELDTMVQNLSPEEKQQLDEMSKRMGERIDEMFAQDPTLQQRIQEDPSVLESFLNTVITPEIEQIESAAKEQPVEPQPVVEEKKPIKEEPKKEYVNYDAIIATLDSIIDSFDAFEVKTEGLARFSEQYEKWVKDKRITRSEEATTWKQFKEKAEKFKQTLHQLEQEEDPAAIIKKYKHIDNLVADKPLWKNLEQLDHRLHASIPQIQKESTRTHDLTAAGKDAARNTLNTILEGISWQSKLEEVIKKYEKRAGELRNVEKKHEEKARAESKKSRPSQAALVIPDRGGRGEYQGYTPEAGLPHGGMYPWEQNPAAQPWKPEAAEKGGKGPESKDAKGKNGKKGKPAKDKSKVSKEEEALSNAVEQLLGELEAIQMSIEYNEQLQNFGSYMSITSIPTAAESKKNADDLVDALNTINEGLDHAVSYARKELKSKMLNVNEATKKIYIKEIKDALDSKDFAMLKNLVSTTKSLTEAPNRIGNEMNKYRFLQDQKNRIDQAEAKKQKPTGKFKDITKTTDIALIPARYERLEATITDFAKLKQRASARKREQSRAAHTPAAIQPEKGE
jgi:hypothetical protein